jgi:hypothetical protein
MTASVLRDALPGDLPMQLLRQFASAPPDFAQFLRRLARAAAGSFRRSKMRLAA